LHHVVLERWSRGESPLHRRDPRAKIAALLVFLIVIATSHRGVPALAAVLFVVICGSAVWARLPLGGVLLRAAAVFPFTLAFAGICWAAGDPARGISVLFKAYLSALTALVVVSTTPLPLLLRGLEMTGAPRYLLMVVQVLYRYLFVISEEAQHMVIAARSRGWVRGRLRFRAAAGALAVLFARSYTRAQDIHRAMLARGFSGHFQTLGSPHFRSADGCFMCLACLLPILIRAAIERRL
jgi:cobalt/nickel transport system permease protein